MAAARTAAAKVTDKEKEEPYVDVTSKKSKWARSKKRKVGKPVCKAYFKPDFNGTACTRADCDRDHPTVCQSCTEKRDRKCQRWHILIKTKSSSASENRPRGKKPSSFNPKVRNSGDSNINSDINHSNLRLKLEVSEKLRYKAELQAIKLRASQQGKISYSQVASRQRGALSPPISTPVASSLPGVEAMPKARFLDVLEKMADLEKRVGQEFKELTQALWASQS